MNPIFYIDFYKVGHVIQYPSDTEQVWSNWTARATRLEGVTSTVVLGFNYFAKRILIREFDLHFFSEKWNHIEAQYRAVIKATLGVENPKVDHIKALWDLGYLPLKFYGLPEGSHCPIGVPQLVVTNTRPEFYWLPNYLESVMSCILWKPSTSATMALQYRKLFESYARKAGETDLSFVDWQGHDFSMRGMSGLEDVMLSGLGHLTCFSGTDSVPAILAAQEYYNAPLTVGGSVPATEHSVMCAGGEDGEFETFERLLTEVYPSGIVSIVSDTWDLWQVLTDFVPRLKSKILARDGKVVIRPDSGDPVKIMCGDDDAPIGSDEFNGAIVLLGKALGCVSNRFGYGTINKGGLIYGDSITLERAKDILEGCMSNGYHPYNLVFGIGSFTYEYVTRDTHYHAMKATAVKRAGKIIPIFKNPKTDDGRKKSLVGIPAVFLRNDAEHGREYYVVDQQQPEVLDACQYQKLYEDGKLLVDPTFDEIRKRVRA